MPPTSRGAARAQDARRDPAAPFPVTAGDLVVFAVSVGMRAAYSISGMPGPDPVVFASMGEASRYARDHAARTGVDVWVEQGAGHVMRVARFRCTGARAT
jgi:hypothetical protein